MYKRIMSEDKFLCINAQKNLNAGVFVSGEMHPTMEKGPLFFQKTIREVVQAHHKREQDTGSEIWPARQKVPQTALTSGRDIAFCSALDCSSKQRAELAF